MKIVKKYRITITIIKYFLSKSCRARSCAGKCYREYSQTWKSTILNIRNHRKASIRIWMPKESGLIFMYAEATGLLMWWRCRWLTPANCQKEAGIIRVLRTCSCWTKAFIIRNCLLYIQSLSVSVRPIRAGTPYLYF